MAHANSIKPMHIVPLKNNKIQYIVYWEKHCKDRSQKQCAIFTRADLDLDWQHISSNYCNTPITNDRVDFIDIFWKWEWLYVIHFEATVAYVVINWLKYLKNVYLRSWDNIVLSHVKCTLTCGICRFFHRECIPLNNFHLWCYRAEALTDVLDLKLLCCAVSNKIVCLWHSEQQ